MRIAVIGAGIVGVTTAYMLARQGHLVQVFDREPGPAMESSFANGGQLSYGFASPMGSPAMFGKIPGILFGADRAFKLPTTISADFAKWGLQFLRHCGAKQAAKDAAQLSHLAAKSGDAFRRIVEQTDLSFGHRVAGKLVLVPTRKEFDALAKQTRNPDAGSERALLNWRECLDLEPALGAYCGSASGGVWVAGDEVGDAARFSAGLAEHAEKQFGAKFRFNSDVSRIVQSNAGVEAIELSSDERIDCDAVIVCTGVAGKQLLAGLGLRLPVYPIMGYSMTAPPGALAPEIAITDAAHKVVFSQIGESVRIAGYADFGMATEERRRLRVQELIVTARKLMPQLADYARITSTWIGARPATPSSLPIVGSSTVPGLYLNMGHGMFGWTLSAGAAESIADTIGPATMVSRAA